MDKRKIIKVTLIVLGIMFGCAFLEAGIRQIVTFMGEHSEKKQEEERQKEIYNSDAAKKERQVATFIENIYDAIVDKDYNYVMLSLDETYKNYMFNNDINKLNEYIENKFVFGESINIVRINNTGGLYQVLAGITSGDSYVSQAFTVDVLNENACTLMFGEYTKIKTMTEMASYPNIKYDMMYCYQTPEITAYVFDVSNATDSNLNIEILDTCLISNNGKVYNGAKPEAFSVEADGTQRIELYFSKKTESMSYLIFNVKENDTEKEVKITFSNGID